MPSAALRSVEAVGRLARLGERAARVDGRRNHLRMDLDRKALEVQTLTTQIDKLLKVEELFRVLMDRLVVKQVRALEAIVTEGLQTIFWDQDLRFESDIEAKYNKVAIDFHVRQGAPNDPLSVRGKPLESFGGGASSVIALILRVVTLLKLKKLPFIVLDETLLAVSDEYIAPTGKFLKAMAQSMNLHFLLITHKSAYCDYSDVAYQCHEESLGDQRALRAKRAASGDRSIKARP